MRQFAWLRKRHGSWSYRAPALSAILLAILIASSAGPVSSSEDDAFRFNRLLGRGINLGAALEAPREGMWGVTLDANYFQIVKDSGFQSVRIPIQWSAHSAVLPPYGIDSSFFQRVDWAIEQALSRELVVVINVHHFVDMAKQPVETLPRLIAIWKQIAIHYRDYSDRLFFELLNEPEGQLNDERWQQIFPELLKVVRETNPERIVIIGPGYWNHVDHLRNLLLPEQDRRLIVTFHYYLPFPFTHQGASWVKGSSRWRGTTWNNTFQEREALRLDFRKAATWSNEKRRPLYLGEFGAHQDADIKSRALWTRAVAREAEKHGVSWAYWDFASQYFGAYDLKIKRWRQPLLEALIEQTDGRTLDPSGELKFPNSEQ